MAKPKAPSAPGPAAKPKARAKAKKRPSPISKSALAERKGVSRGAVTKACYPGGPLEAALLAGGRIDIEHPATKAWLAAGTAGAATAPKVTLPEGIPSPEDIEALGHLTLQEIVDRYGTVGAFIDHVDARKKIAETHRVELANAETEGRLIDRELVKKHVFGAIDAVNRRLLGDAVKTLIRRAYQLNAAGAPLEEAERVGREIMSGQLAQMKSGPARALRGGKA